MIYQADTYHYDRKHFNRDTNCPDGKPGECYTNVKVFAKHYEALGKSVNIILAFGGRAWSCANVFGFHYLLQDSETGEYIDPQYGRFTFFPVHKWTVKEYKLDSKEHKKKFGYIQAEEFAGWYCENHKDYVEAGSFLIRAMANHRKPSKSIIKERMTNLESGVKPAYGESLIKKVLFD